jgi:hypothetical protein
MPSRSRRKRRDKEGHSEGFQGFERTGIAIDMYTVYKYN